MITNSRKNIINSAQQIGCTACGSQPPFNVCTIWKHGLQNSIEFLPIFLKNLFRYNMVVFSMCSPSKNEQKIHSLDRLARDNLGIPLRRLEFSIRFFKSHPLFPTKLFWFFSVEHVFSTFVFYHLPALFSFGLESISTSKISNEQAFSQRYHRVVWLYVLLLSYIIILWNFNLIVPK